MGARVLKKRSRNHGFTLIELLVVLVILGLLAGIVGPRLFGIGDDARKKTTKVQIENLSNALKMFQLEVGRFPTTSEGLSALVEQPGDAERWNGPYLDKKFVPKDDWENEFEYRSPSDNGPFEIVSYGADKVPGNDDIVSWE